MPPQNQQNPSNWQPQPDYSIDYFNEISTPANNNSGPSSKVIIIAIVAGLLSVILFAFMIFGGGASVKDQTLALQRRMLTLQTVTDDYHKYLKSSELRQDDTSLQLFLTDSLSEIKTPMENIGIDPKKSANKKLDAKEAEYKKELADKFEDARLNAVLDRTYARDIAYELNVLRSMMQEISSRTKNKSVKDFVEKSDNNLKPVIERVKKFTNDN